MYLCAYAIFLAPFSIIERMILIFEQKNKKWPCLGYVVTCILELALTVIATVKNESGNIHCCTAKCGSMHQSIDIDWKGEKTAEREGNNDRKSHNNLVMFHV